MQTLSLLEADSAHSHSAWFWCEPTNSCGWFVVWGGKLTTTATNLYHPLSKNINHWVVWFYEVSLDQENWSSTKVNRLLFAMSHGDTFHGKLGILSNHKIDASLLTWKWRYKLQGGLYFWSRQKSELLSYKIVGCWASYDNQELKYVVFWAAAPKGTKSCRTQGEFVYPYDCNLTSIQRLARAS